MLKNLMNLEILRSFPLVERKLCRWIESIFKWDIENVCQTKQRLMTFLDVN